MFWDLDHELLEGEAAGFRKLHITLEVKLIFKALPDVARTIGDESSYRKLVQLLSVFLSLI